MKPIFILLILSFITLHTFSQQKAVKKPYVGKRIPICVHEEKASIDHNQYIGGTKAYMKFITDNLHVPKKSLKTKKSTVSAIIITIDSIGMAYKYSIYTGECGACDTEALKVVRQINSWKQLPGAKFYKALGEELTFPVEVQFPKWDLIKEQFKDTAIYYYRDEWEKHHPRKRKK